MFTRSKNLVKGSGTLALLFLPILFISWRYNRSEENWKWIQRCLLQSFNQSAEAPLKKWDLSVTPEGFFRLKKYFPSGKQEYFSFHFKRLKEIDYEGTPASGDIIFKTTEDDIIVQTYNDPKGNIDSMATVFKLPVLNIEPQTLDSLKINISSLKGITQ